MNVHYMRHLRSILLCGVACQLALTGCAPRDDKSLKKIQLKLSELAQHREDDQRDIQELDSRLFLLEDKVDTLKVMQQRKAEPSRHPVIRIEHNKNRKEAKPAADAPATPEIVEEEKPATGGESLVESNDVVYEGDAKKKGPRLLLKLDGSSYRPPAEYRAPSSKPRSTTLKAGGSLSGERLEVVPLPRGSASEHASSAAPPVASPAPVSEGKVAGGKAAVRAYQKGLQQFQAGNYAGAIKIFKSFAANHSRHPYADNALYWLGECHYDMREYRKALILFRKVVDEYPDENKAPDSLLKMSFCHMNLGDMKASCRVLRQVSQRYPGTSVSRLAVDTLNKKCK